MEQPISIHQIPSGPHAEQQHGAHEQRQCQQTKIRPHPGIQIVLAVWAAQQLWNKSKKSRCEQELAEYKALVMQGVAVTAPRCTQ